MNKKKQKNISYMIILMMALVIQLGYLMHLVNSIQGNGRVLNYAGIVRGATQRLVKNELYGKSDDSEIERLDDILLGLQTGGGSQKLIALKDTNFQNQLSELATEWEKVKVAIYDLRDNPDRSHELYDLSEHYFTMADKTVGAAEEFEDGIAKKIRTLEITIAMTIFLLLAILLIQITAEIRNNLKLNQIAYVDLQTGLPNKRSCDQKLNDGLLIEPGQNVCCMMFDLNNLKMANDTFGHEIGDALINSFASILRRNMPGDMFVGRFGGDEFIGIQINANKEDILERIEQMKKEANTTNTEHSLNGIKISFAYGFAFSDENTGCTMKALMNIADKNMYFNKRKMKNEI